MVFNVRIYGILRGGGMNALHTFSEVMPVQYAQESTNGFLFAPKANQIHAFCASPTLLRSSVVQHGHYTHIESPATTPIQWVLNGVYNVHEKRTVA